MLIYVSIKNLGLYLKISCFRNFFRKPCKGKKIIIILSNFAAASFQQNDKRNFID